jgi:hypothetical protein
VYAEDENSSRSLLRQGGVDGQYVVQLFKWIKQHLRIKAFYGTSQNAVKTQIWIAITIYVLIAIIKKELGLSVSIYQILQVVSVTVFERVPILQALQHEELRENLGAFSNQLNLFTL